MESYAKLVLTFVLVLVSVQSTQAEINCYSCYNEDVTPVKPHCGDPFNSTGVYTVGEAAYCTKATITTELDGSTYISVDRDHEDEDGGEPPYLGCQTTGTAPAITVLCNCDTNLCNGAAILTHPGILLGTLYIALMYIALR